MKNFLTTAVISIFALTLVSSPLAVVAQNNVTNYDTPGLVKCDGAPLPGEDKKRCNFAEFIKAIQYLINWMITISFFLVILVFAYAGILFMSGSEGNIKKAKSMFSKVVIGYIFMLGAWLLVQTIMKLMVSSQDYLYFFK
jgi:hypothetical protein